jgi:hypothetical protein
VETIFVCMVWILFTLGFYLHSRELKRAGALRATDEEKTDEEKSDDEKVIHVDIVEEVKC